MRPYVLLIEDNLADAELTRAALGNSSLDVEFVHAFTAEEGATLLRAMLQRPTPPSAALVLLDLGLPRSDGLEVLRQLKSAEDGTVVPIIVYSGTENKATVRAAMAGGANAFVHKASDLDVYFKRIGSVVEAFLVHTVSAIAPD